MKNNTLLLILWTILAANTTQIQAASVRLINGDLLNGDITTHTEASIELAHPLLGNLNLPREQIDSISEDPQPAAENVTAQQEPLDDGVFHSGFLTGWTRELAVGINGAEGNSSNAKLHIDVKANMENESDRWIFRSAYNGKSEDGDTTENSLFATLDRDWLLPDSPWFWFARGRFDWDEFQDWDYRLGGYLGPGYQFMDTDAWNLRGRFGAGGTQTWGGEDEGFTPEVLLGLDLAWRINADQSLQASTTFYPDIQDLGEFRNISTLDWKINISDFYRGIALKIGLSNEYQSLVPASDSHNDFKYNMALLMGL